MRTRTRGLSPSAAETPPPFFDHVTPEPKIATQGASRCPPQGSGRRAFVLRLFGRLATDDPLRQALGENRWIRCRDSRKVSRKCQTRIMSREANFDTEHRNHIFWKDADDLRERLRVRIAATIPK